MVTSPPHDNFTATAIHVIETALVDDSIDVLGVFFYQNGVLNASQNLSMPNDELQAITQWKTLHTTYNVPLHLCITAGEKRGLSDEITQENHLNIPEKLVTQSNICEEFTVSGLGELVELTTRADRFIQL